MTKRFAKAIFVIGPTASGKTALAHDIARRVRSVCRLECELVNLDAFQFYKGVDLGTAKPTPTEIKEYSYHGIDFLDPLESMDASRYADFVHSACRRILAAGRIPICVGGSGLYLRAVLHGLDELPPRNDQLRQMFRASADVWGWPELHRWLVVLSPVRAAQLHPNDKTRIERALEIVFQLSEGTSLESLMRSADPLSEQKTLGDCYVIQVDCEDEILKQRIARRLEGMFAQGWPQEVLRLKRHYGAEFLASQAGKALGYRQISDAWEVALGEGSELDDSQVTFLKREIATLTWQYVRRQRTWNAKERKDWFFDSTSGIAEIQFPASFLSFLNNLWVE